METKEILEVLYKMRDDYADIIENFDLDRFLGSKFRNGLCAYFAIELFFYKDTIINELFKDNDSVKNNRLMPYEYYWYKVCGKDFLLIEEIIPFQLKPRLDNINRTIARLENSLK